MSWGWSRRTAVAVTVGVLTLSGMDGGGAQEPPPPPPPPPSCPAAPTGPGPSVTIEKPAEGAVAKSTAEALVGGLVEAANNGTVDCVLLTATRVDENNQSQEVDREVINLPDGPVSYEFTWAPHLPYNDTYAVVAQAVGRRFGNPFASTPVTRQFRTEIPPARVAGLKVTADKEKRTATLVWNKNPEPDVVGYIVRRVAGDPKFSAEASPTEPTHTDDLSTAPAGSYRYHVVAVRQRTRNPADGGIESTTPAEGSVTIAGPPTATSPSTTPTTRRTATTARRPRNRAPNRVDLGRFGPTSTLPESLEPAEGAFGDLEFGERQRGRTDMTITELGEPVTEDGDDRPTSLLFFAAGLLAFVVLLHLRWLKKEVDRVPLEEVPPEA